MQGQPLLPAALGPALHAGGGATSRTLVPGHNMRARGLAAGAGVYTAALPAVSLIRLDPVRTATAGGVR